MALYGNYNNSLTKGMAAQVRQKEKDKLKYNQDVALSLRECQIDNHKTFVKYLSKQYSLQNHLDSLRIGEALFHMILCVSRLNHYSL